MSKVKQHPPARIGEDVRPGQKHERPTTVTPRPWPAASKKT